MASSTNHGSLVVSSSCQESDESLFLGPQRLQKNIGVGTYSPIRRPRIPLFKGGESVKRVRLGRRLVNILQVAQRTNALHKYCKVTWWRHGVSPCRSAYFASPWWLLTLTSLGISPLGYWQKVNPSPTQTKPYNTLPPFEQRDSRSSYGAVRAYSDVLL